MTTQIQRVPALRFPGFSEEWEEKKLEDIGKIIRGASPRPKGDPRYYGGNVPRLMVQDVTRDGKYVTPKIDSLTEEGAKLSRPCKAGTLTIVCSGTVGVVSFLAVDACIHDGFLALTEIDKSVIFDDFLFQQLGTLRESFEKGATHGGVFTNLTTSNVKLFKIKTPTLPEQQKIASFLSSVDAKIEQLTKKKAKLEKYKKGIMQKLFDQEIRFKDYEGKEHPEWEEKKLGDIATFSKGKGISKLDISSDGGLECIRYGELYTTYGETISNVKSRTNVPADKLVISIENDVIIPASGETAIDIATASCVIRSGIALGGDLNIIRSKENGVFLSYYLNSVKKNDIARLSQGVSVMHLYSSQLRSLELKIPHLNEQKHLADFLSSIDDKIERVGGELEKAKTFKKGLLQQMFV